MSIYWLEDHHFQSGFLYFFYNSSLIFVVYFGQINSLWSKGRESDLLSTYLFARTHAQLESTMPLTCHDWTTITAYQVSPSTCLYTITVWGTTVQCIYTKHPNHSWRNDYDWGCTKNTLTALYTTDQQHVLACGTNLSRNNHRRRGRLCTTLISLYWSTVLTFHGTITVGKVDDVPTRSVSTDWWYLPSMEQSP